MLADDIFTDKPYFVCMLGINVGATCKNLRGNYSSPSNIQEGIRMMYAKTLGSDILSLNLLLILNKSQPYAYAYWL